MSKEDYVEVTVKIHKGIVAFLRDMEKVLNMTMEEYVEYSIYQSVGADLETHDVFVPEVKETIEKYGLAKALIHSIVSSECKEILAKG